ncbi:MAG TPA: thioredoxin family protein [Steroidobacteraceae bacterium]|nr:thioredoxin family protein [Steroidobacteraceae bacterium]
MTEHRIVSREEWVSARLRLLAKEKELQHLRDELSAERRKLPWERVEKSYVFDGPSGQETLDDLFAGRSQLAIYHFMFAPEWDAGCRGCAFWADNFNGIVPHLAGRDVSFAAVSRAPLPKLRAFAARMGWTFHWVSSANTDFNYDYQASFRSEEVELGRAVHNYEPFKEQMTDKPGVSVFFRDDSGRIFHTYSTYARGIDPLNVAYQLLDLSPKGRDEDQLPHTMSWVRFHDAYGA